jgi:hypothetical protein
MDLKLFRELFCRIDDAFGRMTSEGPKSVRSPLPDDMILAHLAGSEMIGAYFLDHDGMADQLVIDIDTQQPDLARMIERLFGELGIRSYIEASKSRGYHVRAHWDSPVPAADLRRIGAWVVHQAGIPNAEVFPKQDQRGTGGLGNFMWLPLQGECLKFGGTAILDDSNGLAPLDDQWDAIQSIQRNCRETLAAATAIVEKDEPTRNCIKKVIPPVMGIIPEGQRNNILTSLAGSMRRRNMSTDAIVSALLTENASRCVPPLPEIEVRNIVASVARYRPVETEHARKPRIILNVQHLPTFNEKCWEAMRLANDPLKYFRHGGIPVRLENDDRGALIIRPLTPERARYELANAAEWIKFKGGKKRRTVSSAIPPLDVIKDWLATPDPPLPVLERIVEVPVFASDGTLHSTEGYNSASRSFHSPSKGLIVPDVSEDPSRSDVEKAKEIILEPLAEFPFVSDADKANAIGMSLLPPARDLIDGATPNHLIEAPVAGSGKGLLANVLLMPVIGGNIGVVPETQNEEEIRKRITAQLLAARPAILLDNVNRPIESGVFSTALTATKWDDRNLGNLEMHTLPVRCVWVTTANNPTMSTEIARRCVRIRLDPRIDRPWLRDGFRHPDLLGWVKENRGELVWAVLTLIKAWIIAGRPRPRVKPLGSFEKWTEVIGGILEHAGIPGFLENTAEFYELADAEGAAWRTFVTAWWDKYQDTEVGAAKLFPLTEEIECFDLGKGGERSQKTTFGKMLGKQRDRVIGDYRIMAVGKSNRANRWKLQKAQRA